MAQPRLFITTDMQMMSGVNDIHGDKDDVQSLVHALMYQDKVNIVGIASSTSRHQPGANDDDFIHRVIDAYAKDYSKLAAQSKGFKTAEELHDITYQGTKSLAGTSGVPAATEASKKIIEAARAAEKAGEPLYVATWGGMGDVARALRDAPDIADTLRLLTASGPKQEPNAYAYVKDKFAGEGDLWWVDAQSTQVGIWVNPDGRDAPLNNSWAVSNAKGHGALGQTFYENTVDVKGKADDISAVKMGDSFSVFYLIDQASNNDPTGESWGGSFKKADDQYWTDRTDIKFDWNGSNGSPTTYEFRDEWRSDFAERLDWLKGGGTTTPSKPEPAPAPSKPEKPSAEAPEPSKPTKPVDPPKDAPAPSDDGQTLNGGSRADNLKGGTGDDLLDGKGGADTMSGGKGDDVYHVRDYADIVREMEGWGDDAVHAHISWKLSDNVEDLFLRGPKDTSATGNGLDNLITGNSGDNKIDGQGGDDRLEGRGGDDTITGGAGDDLLIGGAGKDSFVFGKGSGDDTITDFAVAGRQDRIVIKGYDDYSVKQKGADALVTFGDESILLKDIQASSLSSSDFLFA